MITDKDGSCRDINFDGVKWSGVEAYINKVSGLYSSLKCQAWEPEGEAIEVDSKEIVKRLKIPKTSAQIYSEDINNIIKQLQIYLFTEENGQPFIELTFFPEDINIELKDIDLFIKLIKDWNDTLAANKYYVRYENASWEFGDISKYSGIIYTSEMEIA